MSEVTSVASVITKITATPMPKAVLNLLETPKKGQMPKNCDKTILFTNTQAIIIKTYSIVQSF